MSVVKATDIDRAREGEGKRGKRRGRGRGGVNLVTRRVGRYNIVIILFT